MTKVLLINPNLTLSDTNRDSYVPSGLLYIASYLKSKGIEVDFVNFCITPFNEFERVIENKIDNFEPDVIGIGCLFSFQFKSVIKISKFIKSKSDIPIMIGGAHPTIHHYDILCNCDFIDFVVLGEGEKSSYELVNCIVNKVGFLIDVDGIAYRQDSRIEVNRNKFERDLDVFPLPAYDLINLEDYYDDTSNWHNPKNLPINVSLHIISSRGCFMKCNFCSNYCVMGNRWRYRSHKNVVDEIEFLYKEYNHRHFSFMDDNFTASRKRTKDICKEINDRRLDIQFDIPNGVYINTLDNDIIKILVEAGLVRMSLAIESGSDYIRNDIIGKNLNRKKIFSVTNETKKYKDLVTRAFFIIGFPEDTHETLDETYNMMRYIDVNIPIVSNLMPYYGTRVFEQCVRDKLFVKTLDLDELWLGNKFYLASKDFFVKPYNLEIEDLYDFRMKCDEMLSRKL